jgi:hypothetical protein
MSALCRVQDEEAVAGLSNLPLHFRVDNGAGG